jgi:hypothetical protein
MRVTFCSYRDKLYVGSFATCLTWASTTAKLKNQIIPIYRARPDSKNALLLAEVDSEGVRLINNGTYVNIKKSAKWASL